MSDLKDWDRQKQVSDELRNRALERLYSRKAVVDELIRSLENYRRFPLRKGPAQCVPIRKWS
ncbi:MAG TPA: hypothetical protein VKU19_31165 [Bryobacteraceae bacterium]|nr:hypothetical protein [Bryobacteraceae bacterium]